MNEPQSAEAVRAGDRAHGLARDYPIRQKSAQGQPAPLTSITRRCKACGACFIGLAPGKTGKRGLWDHGSRWYCSMECAPADVREAAGAES